MPYKRPWSAYYRLRPRQYPGYGKLGEVSCRVKNISVARQMETLIRRVYERGLEDSSWFRLLDALVAKTLTLPELLKAQNENRLDDLKAMWQDPPLASAIEEFRKSGVSYEVDNGLRLLQAMAEREYGPKATFSKLRVGKNITLLCARAEREGGRPSDEHPIGRPLKRNYVLRSLRNAASLLVQFHLGPDQRDKIFRGASFTAEDDARDQWLTPDQLWRLVESCAAWLRPYVLVAASSGADRAPLLRLLVRDVEIFEIEVEGGLLLTAAKLYLRDKKTTTRPRTIIVVGPAAESLVPLTEGKGPDEKVFHAWTDEEMGRPLPLTDDRLRRGFEAAREAAGLTKKAGLPSDFRLKDLRHTTAVAADKAGFSITETGQTLGHKRRETSLKYTNREVQLKPEDAVRLTKQLGLLNGVGSAQTGRQPEKSRV